MRGCVPVLSRGLIYAQFIGREGLIRRMGWPRVVELKNGRGTCEKVQGFTVKGQQSFITTFKTVSSFKNLIVVQVTHNGVFTEGNKYPFPVAAKI